MSYVSDALIDAQERKIKKLKAENSKLREIVADMFQVTRAMCKQFAGCDNCCHCPLAISDEYCELGKLRFGPMQELEIEVDE